MNFRAVVIVVLLLAPTGVAQLNRPTDVATRGEFAYVANRGSGAVTVVDPKGDILSQAKVGRSLSSLALVPEGIRSQALAVDRGTEEVLALKLAGSDVSVVERLLVRHVEGVAVDPGGSLAVAFGRWSKVVNVLALSDKLALRASIEIGFSPGEVLALGANQFLVADKFGGRLAMLDAGAGKVIHQTKLRGHNIRGLLRVGDEVLIAHQILSEVSRTEFADVHWGTLMQNVVSRVPIDRLVTGELRPTTVALGDVERGAADPAGMALLGDGRIAVALSGVDEVLISQLPGRRGRFQFAAGDRIKVGVRPVRLATGGSGGLFVVNMLGHSVSIIDSNSSVRSVDGDHEAGSTAEERGERAFFSGRLSHDSWLSCNSCHVAGHTPGLLADTLGDDAYGNPKLIPSLLGIGQTATFGWSGNFDKLEPQVAKSIRTTMHGKGGEQTVASIAAYLRTLASPSSVGQLGPVAKAGQAAFLRHKCGQCHQPESAMTSPGTFDVGFQDELGQSRFNPPSLRAIRFRDRFFHDGRAGSLDEALRSHTESLQKEVEAAELKGLRAYLLSL